MGENESMLKGLVPFGLLSHRDLSLLGPAFLRNYFFYGQLSISFAFIYTSQINHTFVLFFSIQWVCNSFSFFFFLNEQTEVSLLHNSAQHTPEAQETPGKG